MQVRGLVCNSVSGSRGELRIVLGVHADLVGLGALVLELHDAVDEGVDRVVRAQADVAARVPLGAALPDDDVAGADDLRTS